MAGEMNGLTVFCVLPSAYCFSLLSVGEQAYQHQAHDKQEWYSSTPNMFLISCCSKAASTCCLFLMAVLLWLERYQAFLLLSLVGVSVKRRSRKDIITWRINPDDERNHHGNCQSRCSWELMQTGGCDCYSKSEPQSSSWHANSL